MSCIDGFYGVLKVLVSPEELHACFRHQDRLSLAVHDDPEAAEDEFVAAQSEEVPESFVCRQRPQ